MTNAIVIFMPGIRRKLLALICAGFNLSKLSNNSHSPDRTFVLPGPVLNFVRMMASKVCKEHGFSLESYNTNIIPV